MNDEPTSEVTTGTEPEPINNEPEQSPLDQEIEKEEKRSGGRTEAEKAAFSLLKNAERAKELGVDIDEVLGRKKQDNAEPVLDKDAPLTVGMYEQMQRNNSQKSAIELAQNIADPKERDLTISYLKTRIVPSGDAEDDLRFARMAVNSVKNGQIIEEIGRSGGQKNYGSGAGAPPRTVEKEPELTPAEQMFTKAPFSLTPAEIISKRTQN